jgi:hypothetical protein
MTSGFRLTSNTAFDQPAAGTAAFRRFCTRVHRVGYTIRITEFGDDTIAGFDVSGDGTRWFLYDPIRFRIIHLLHENRHLSQLVRATRIGIDVFGPSAAGRGAIRRLLETEAYGMDLWLARRFGFSEDFLVRTLGLLREYTGIIYRLRAPGSEFAELARKLLGYDILPYIPRRGVSPWIQ